MGIILFIIWSLLALLSFHKRKDLFSPMKIYLLMIFVFFGDIFIGNYNIIIYVYVLSILFFGLFIYIIEGKSEDISHREQLIVEKRNSIWIRIWILTIIPVVAQLLLIQKMGGIEGYIRSIGLRVVEWQGFGIHLTLIRSMLVINLLYFILIVKIAHIRRWEKILFIINFLIYIVISLLSGSRSALLVNFVVMFIIYYYYVKKIKIRNFIILGTICLSLASLIGVARSGYSYSDGELKTGLSNEDSKSVEMANFTYGTFPLEVIMEQSEIKDPQYGMTYLTAITNVIPRDIWPNKPASGGVVFTNDYYNIFGGYSNHSTGFIVEGILNFGYLGGTIFAFVLLGFMYVLFIHYFQKKQNFKSLQGSIIHYLIYSNILFFLPTYLYGEFTAVTHAIFISKILLIILIAKFAIPKRINYTQIF